MRFSTPIEISQKTTITHKSEIMLLGSCFVQNIGGKLRELRFKADVNPFGILYNPLSISAAIKRITAGEKFHSLSPELLFHNEQWHSMLHHSDFSHRDKEQTIQLINDRLSAAHNRLPSLDVLVITLGTAYAYKMDGKTVGNCHKLPAKNFERCLLSVDETVEELGNTIKILTELRPNLKILFTVSPIRHLRDGAHANQLSKATLLLAVDKLCNMLPGNCEYFPAYEIVLDELRDYRFYAEDMTHPSSVATEYIWERFSDFCFDRTEQMLNKEITEIVRAMSHRPFDEESAAYHTFIENVHKKITNIIEKHPYIDFEKDLSRCNTLLNR